MDPSFEPILRAPYHLSYPFPILDEGRPILTAESWQAGKTTVWRQGDGRWRADGTLLAGRQVLDPTLWRGPDGWWLFCTFRDDGPDSCLHVFSSNSLQGPWSNHPRNPVITDFGGARPAGPLFVAGDQLIRPAQDCSQTYGGAVVPNVVRRLDTQGYEEEPVRRLEPRPGSYPWGVHTFCPAGNVTLIDGKTWRFDPLELSQRGLRKITGRLRPALKRAAQHPLRHERPSRSRLLCRSGPAT